MSNDDSFTIRQFGLQKPLELPQKSEATRLKQNKGTSLNSHFSLYSKNNRIIRFNCIEKKNDLEASQNIPCDENKVSTVKSPQTSTHDSNHHDLMDSQATSLRTVTFPFFPVGAFLFLFGFVFPPLWWVGMFYPNRSTEDSFMNKVDGHLEAEEFWKALNRFLALGFSTIIFIGISAVIIFSFI